jgi:hypothetical protein
MRSIQNSQDTASREPNPVTTARTGLVTTNDEANDEATYQREYLVSGFWMTRVLVMLKKKQWHVPQLPLFN